MEKTELYQAEPGAAAVGKEDRGRHLVRTYHKRTLMHFIFIMHGLNISRNDRKLDLDLKHTKHLVCHLLWEYTNHWELLDVIARSGEAMLFYEILIAFPIPHHN